MIFELLGQPSDEDMVYLQNERNIELMKKIPESPSKDFDELFMGSSVAGIDLLKKMLTFNPKKRITVEEALEHPFFEDLHCEEDEPACE